MRSTFGSSTLVGLVGCFAWSSLAAAAPPVSQAHYHIVVSRQTLGAGEHADLKLEPPVPAGVRVHWESPVDAGGSNSATATYRAPFVIAPSAPPVTITVSIGDKRDGSSASTVIALNESQAQGSEECLGPGQSFSTTSADIVPHYTFADDLPEAIRRVDPEYAKSARSRGATQTIMVNALVCRSGEVLDAYPADSFTNPGDSQPIEHDPKLVAAAVDAVRRYVFKPAVASGHPIAVWVVVPVKFKH